MSSNRKSWSREEEMAETTGILKKAVSDFWDSFEQQQTNCLHPNVFFGASAGSIICQECGQKWLAVDSEGVEDYAEQAKRTDGRKVR